MEYVQLGLYLIGMACLGYTAFRVWRLAHPPELPPAKDRPSAIKGPMAFTEADGELFRKHGRESELQKLLGLVLDDQVLMVVVRGASGAGKTSPLPAGLKHILGDRATNAWPMKKLELTEPLNLDRFTWLSTDSVVELSLKAASSSNSITELESLSKCSSLKNK